MPSRRVRASCAAKPARPSSPPPSLSSPHEYTGRRPKVFPGRGITTSYLAFASLFILGFLLFFSLLFLLRSLSNHSSPAALFSISNKPKTKGAGHLASSFAQAAEQTAGEHLHARALQVPPPRPPPGTRRHPLIFTRRLHSPTGRAETARLQEYASEDGRDYFLGSPIRMHRQPM